MGKCCWIASLAIQYLFSQYNSSSHFRYLNRHQILYSNPTALKLGSSTYFFPALSVSSVHEVLGVKFNGG